MAKSLRSKSQRHNRNVKRTDPKSAFKLAEDLRLARLNARLKQSSLKPRALTDAEERQRKEDGFETDDNEDAVAVVNEPQAGSDGGDVATSSAGMHIDGSEADESKDQTPAKISTSGPRLSRREQYRTDKRFQVRLPSKTVFKARGETKRMGCKPKRRR
ncbi:hypothetical protein OIV83_001086 [Microbotryomycetes sp. JL201]|nr:hypothetical protein OIV83_001086 [Microbotryomycetes sp. JL201]